MTLQLKSVFTVITGETGSGKSLMLNALATLVGGKIKYSSFTNADKKTIIEGQFILNDTYKSHFEEHEIDFYNECIVRKEISCKGKARVFINDSLTTKSVVSEVFSNINKSDINEEVVRFVSHLDLVKELIHLKQPIGKKLDFYTQELLREANTMSSKALIADIKNESVELKSYIERVKEHAQNVE